MLSAQKMLMLVVKYFKWPGKSSAIQSRNGYLIESELWLLKAAPELRLYPCLWQPTDRNSSSF